MNPVALADFVVTLATLAAKSAAARAAGDAEAARLIEQEAHAAAADFADAHGALPARLRANDAKADAILSK